MKMAGAVRRTEFLEALEHWLAEVLDFAESALPPRTGCTVRVQDVVADLPGGRVGYYTVWVDGRIAELAVGNLVEPEATVEYRLDAFRSYVRGEARSIDEILGGRVSVTGDLQALQRIIPVADSVEWRDVLNHATTATGYGDLLARATAS